MNFDQRIEEAYSNDHNPNKVIRLLERAILAFPPGQRLLVGARASFIKHKLLYEGKIEARHIEALCGLCIYTSHGCLSCPAEAHCQDMAHLKPQERMNITYDIYMEEHNKFA